MRKIRSDLDQNLLQTPRLDLLPLRADQLQTLLENPSVLEEINIDESMVDDNVIRALGMKLEKMKMLPVVNHLWQTYWLIIIRDKNIGAGLAGFKYSPDDDGLTEIGYGIAPAYQNQGYMSEAVRSLVDWAFAHKNCIGVTAFAVTNPASNSLLEKLGAEIVDQDGKQTSWLIKRRS